jgi:hypothetical protein
MGYERWEVAINEEAVEFLLLGSLGVVREGDDGADAEVEAGPNGPALLVEISGTGPMHTERFCNAGPSIERVRERINGLCKEKKSMPGNKWGRRSTYVPALISSISLACFLASMKNRPLPRTPCCWGC